jgi:hypothetical protein
MSQPELSNGLDVGGLQSKDVAVLNDGFTILFARKVFVAALYSRWRAFCASGDRVHAVIANRMLSRGMIHQRVTLDISISPVRLSQRVIGRHTVDDHSMPDVIERHV